MSATRSLPRGGTAARAPRAPRAPVRVRAQEQARATVEAAILAGAARVIARVGFRRLKMTELAHEAGVGVGTLYNYFASRDALIKALLADGQARFLARMGEPLTATAPLERLRERVCRCLAFIEEHGAVFAELVRESLGAHGDLRDLVRDRSQEEHLRFRGWLAGDLAAAERRPGLAPAELAVLLGGLMNATILHWLETGRRHSLTGQADSLLDVFLNGVLPR
jgi:AcrR family transcriptional regulator